MRTLKIINLTPHEINLMDPSGTMIYHTFPPAAKAPRCKFKTDIEESVQLEGTDVIIPLTYTMYEKSDELPSSKPHTLYIVSELIAKKHRDDRDDLRIVNGIIKKDGKVIGCRSLGRI